MATKKSAGGAKGSSNVGWGSGSYPTVGNVGNASSEEKRDATPWYLIFAALVVLITFFIVMPIVGFMVVDMHYVTNAAIHEVRKMKELRRQLLEERRQEQQGGANAE